MPSEALQPEPQDSRRLGNLFRIWNRKVHFYAGLYFLFFTWLFAFTGLILNHSWQFAQFYPNRKITTQDRAVRIPSPLPDNTTLARDLLTQLGIRGEIVMGPPSKLPGILEFSAAHPGTVHQVQANLGEGRAHIVSNQYNVWGIVHTLHTFTGLSLSDKTQQRDWPLATVWAFAMDAVAVGLIVMVLSSYYMWWLLRQKRTFGFVALAAGCLSCFLFVYGLRWIYS